MSTYSRVGVVTGANKVSLLHIAKLASPNMDICTGRWTCRGPSTCITIPKVATQFWTFSDLVDKLRICGQ
jgi:hypothetical protein